MTRPTAVKLALAVIVIGVAAFLFLRYVLAQKPSRAELRLSGNIEITDAEVSFRIPGHVTERMVDEGDNITQGEMVALLENTDLRHEVILRQAEVDNARAVLAEMTSGYRPEEIAQAEAALDQAAAELVRAEAEWHRDQELFAQDLISARDAETSRATYAVAQGRVAETGERLAMLRKGFRIEQIDQARAQLQVAEESLAKAQTNLGFSVLVAPMDGVVLSKNVEPGEYVAAGTPVVTIGLLDPLWLKAYIAETDLGRVKLGQSATVTTDTYPGREYRGKVTFIAQDAEFTPKNVQTEMERVKLVYRIKITLPNQKQELKPGMPADAVIDLSGN